MYRIRKRAIQQSAPQFSLLLSVGSFATEVISLEDLRQTPSEVCSVRLLGSDKSEHNKWNDRPTVKTDHGD